MNILGENYFFTGFPGFICNQLIREILQRRPMAGIVYMLVLPHMKEKAQEELTRIARETGRNEWQFQIIEGDITKAGLGIQDKDVEVLKSAVTHVFHLAAVYDLAVPREIAWRVNVEGTRNVNEWVKVLQHIKRYTYFSTAYVAGRREGTLLETELIHPSEFKNHYEETKYEAEVLVEQLKRDVPTTIIRPGIVKGHSKTGETIKFDGPYFIMNFLDRLRFLPFIPRLGNSDAEINLVPVDYIIAATAFLAFLDKGEGKTYHLTDPSPYTVSEIYEMVMKELLGKKPTGTLPLGLAKASLMVPAVRRLLGVEKEALEYFTWKGRFDCSQAGEDLLGSGISCPDFKNGIAAMAEFYSKNKQNPDYQLKIV
ncbi:3-beta hydroxysteroid dehydrogenase [Bacillus sp. FJAT-27225]|uniref:SDR family oxidoreductase n=1 Tax=Bacillus sp. FJAT-27225 TaxID=1743144 RepID=UPI00080C2C42|nr:SDR family oxidoreductase [Bacillus sp. FJAT-27225]OCA85659.1 3-beta hydroxysteroid dehydrogenase [Bacillus sp. FJAT-27225]